MAMNRPAQFRAGKHDPLETGDIHRHEIVAMPFVARRERLRDFDQCARRRSRMLFMLFRLSAGGPPPVRRKAGNRSPRRRLAAQSAKRSLSGAALRRSDMRVHRGGKRCAQIFVSPEARPDDAPFDIEPLE